MEIIIDTSSLLFSVKNKCDIILKVSQQFNNAQIAISDGILRELKGLSSGNSNLSIIAKTTMEILKNKKVKVYNNNEYVDQWIYNHALENKTQGIGQVIVTNDTEIYNRIKSEKITVKKSTIKCLLK
jgi:rRNA-processing protein FCF1